MYRRSRDGIVLHDEYNFIWECNSLQFIRKEFISLYYYEQPSLHNYKFLMTSEASKVLCNLGKYIYLAFKERQAFNILLCLKYK